MRDFVNLASEVKGMQILTDIIEFSISNGKIRQDDDLRQPVPNSWLKPLVSAHDLASVGNLEEMNRVAGSQKNLVLEGKLCRAFLYGRLVSRRPKTDYEHLCKRNVCSLPSSIAWARYRSVAVRSGMS
jgi:hypothetical protein